MTTPQPIKWPGGKRYLAARIVALMPPHLTYCEPFAGGLAVLLARDPDDRRLWLGTGSGDAGVSEVVNDLNTSLMNFWGVLAGRHFADFARMAQASPFSEDLWEASSIALRDMEGAFHKGVDVSSAHWASAFFVCCRMSLAGRMTCFTPITKNRTRRRMNNEVSAWLTAVDGLAEVHARLRRVLVLCRDAPKVIREFDRPETFFYLDPPYLHETRTSTTEYRTLEMSEAGHVELLRLLGTLRGKFILSGYPSRLYDEAAREYGWSRLEFELPNNAAAGKSKRRMTECLWLNYTPGEEKS